MFWREGSFSICNFSLYRPCYLNLVMISLLASKCQDFKGEMSFFSDSEFSVLLSFANSWKYVCENKRKWACRKVLECENMKSFDSPPYVPLQDCAHCSYWILCKIGKTFPSVSNSITVQVNFFQKQLFLHQINENSKLRTCCVHKLFWMSRQKNNFCTQHVLSLQFSCTELVIQWTICRHIAGYLVDAEIRASDKDSPVNSTRKYIYWTWFIHQLCQWFLDNTEIHQLEGYLYWAWVDFEITCHYLCHWIWLAAASDQKIWGYQKC